jgi:hypothetical protein
MFHARERSLRLSFTRFQSGIRRLTHRRHAGFDGSGHHRHRLLHEGWRCLSLFSFKKGREQLQLCRASLIWLLPRQLCALKQLRENVQLRKKARTMVSEARAAFAQSDRRAACAEFICVAYVAGTALRTPNERRQRLARWAAHKWKRFVAQRRVAHLSHTLPSAKASRIPASAVQHVNNMRYSAPPKISACHHTTPERQDLRLLSKAPPRTSSVESLPPPPPTTQSTLGYLWSSALNRDCRGAPSRPYAHLLLSTPMQRPLPTSCGGPPSSRINRLHETEDSQPPRVIGEGAHELGAAQVAHQVSPMELLAPLQPAVVPVSGALLEAAEKLGQEGTSEATVSLLREYLSML